MARVLVIGGSVAGLFAAGLLRPLGWDVAVCERAEGDLGERGAAIGTTEELLAVMRRIDPAVDRRIGVETRSRILLDRAFNVPHEVPLRGMTSAWSRIYRPLKAALPDHCYHAGAVFTGLTQSADRVTATFADGSRTEGDLLIGADGIHSAVRRTLMPDVEPRYAGYVVWRAVLSEREIPRAVHARIFHHMTFCFPDGEMVLCLPMAGEREASDRRFQFAWFRPTDRETLAAMCTDASGRRHGLSIPPPLIRPELIAELKADGAKLLAPQIADLLARASQPILQPIFDLESPRLVHGRVVLVGDAAFVARPHVATGVTKAALDAQCLADTLAQAAGDIDAALGRYEQAREPAGRRLVARGRYLGEFLEAQPAGKRLLAIRTPETIAREYGAAGVIEEAGVSAHPGGAA
jgi:2-polyprenyl-6-methoxyphenol hydroxylase-like FAD-dependent oxidoreductase